MAHTRRPARTLARRLYRGALPGWTAVLLAGCSLGPVTYSATFPQVEAGITVDAVPIDLIDMTGLVEGIDIATPEQSLGAAAFVRAAGSTIRLEWLGGACEARTRVVFGARDAGYELRISTEPSLGGMLGCVALGVPRAIDVRVGQPLDGKTIRAKSPHQ